MDLDASGRESGGTPRLPRWLARSGGRKNTPVRPPHAPDRTCTRDTRAHARTLKLASRRRRGTQRTPRTGTRTPDRNREGGVMRDCVPNPCKQAARVSQGADPAPTITTSGHTDTHATPVACSSVRSASSSLCLCLTTRLCPSAIQLPIRPLRAARRGLAIGRTAPHTLLQRPHAHSRSNQS